MKYHSNQSPPIAYVVEDPEEFGYIADPPTGFTEGYEAVGYVADPFGADPPCSEMAYIAEEPDEEMAYVAEGPYDEMGYVGQDEEEMAEFADDEEFAAADDEFYEDGAGEWGDGEAMGGYLPETRPPGFSPRVMPVSRLEGYMTPKSINPTAEQIRPAEVVPRPASGWFKPHW